MNDVTTEEIERIRKMAEIPCVKFGTPLVLQLADTIDELRAQLAARPTPVAVEVPEILSRLAEWEEFRSEVSDLSYHSSAMGCGIEDRGIHDRYEACEYGWQEAMERVAERMPEDRGSEIAPSRILKDGEREELEILRKVAKIIDDKRNAQWERRGAGPCQRMPDEIDNLLCDWYEIQAKREYDAGSAPVEAGVPVVLDGGVGTIDMELVRIGYAWLDHRAGKEICSDRTCIRCRLADILAQVEKELALRSGEAWERTVGEDNPPPSPAAEGVQRGSGLLGEKFISPQQKEMR